MFEHGLNGCNHHPHFTMTIDNAKNIKKKILLSENCRYLHRSKDVLHMMEIKCQAFIYNSMLYEE